VVGGGITGLAAAHRVTELSREAEVELWEKSSRTGGVLSTIHRDGFQMEMSADNFITTVPWGLDLCRRLGLEDDLVTTNPDYRRTYVVRKGNLHLLPDGFLMMAPTKMWPLAVTPVLSPLGKMRAGLEYFLPKRRDPGDESMAQFVSRRLGREVFQRLVEPLISGVYAADMTRLSVLATLPRFREMEQNHGSLIRAMRRQMREAKTRRRADRRDSEKDSGAQSGARYSMFVTLRSGLSHLTETLRQRLPEERVHLDCGIVAMERLPGSGGSQWRLTDERGDRHEYDAVVLATPAQVSSKLLDGIDEVLSRRLGEIEHSGTAIVTFAFHQEQIRRSLRGMGFVVPTIEKSPILAGSFSSLKYIHRAPSGKSLIRVFAGGARAPEMPHLDEAKLIPLLMEELRRVLKIEGEPIFHAVARWPETMPQYHVGHVERVAQIEKRQREIPGLAIAGNAFHGVGIPNCIHSGETAVQRLLGE
jgi:oxygen-dependent protoporphyrinogen oxidase